MKLIQKYNHINQLINHEKIQEATKATFRLYMDLDAYDLLELDYDHTIFNRDDLINNIIDDIDDCDDNDLIIEMNKSLEKAEDSSDQYLIIDGFDIDQVDSIDVKELLDNLYNQVGENND